MKKEVSHDFMIQHARNQTVKAIQSTIEKNKLPGSMSVECAILGVVDALIIGVKSLEESRQHRPLNSRKDFENLCQEIQEIVAGRCVLHGKQISQQEQSNQSKTTSGECTESNSQDTSSITAAERAERLYGSTPNSET